jgi:hypothetical protein
MAKALANIRIYGDDAGGVWVAAKGTTGPTTLAAPGVGFSEIGWISEDGISQERSQDATSFRAWQGGQVVRRKITNTEDTFSFQALETNAVTHGLMFRGQTPTIATGVATTVVQNQSVTDERAWVFDMVDGTVTKRYVIPSGAYELSGTIVARNDEMTVHEFTVTPQGAYFHITNAPAIVGP